MLRLKSLWSLWWWGKCWSIKFIISLPTLVFTFTQEGCWTKLFVSFCFFVSLGFVGILYFNWHQFIWKQYCNWSSYIKVITVTRYAWYSFTYHWWVSLYYGWWMVRLFMYIQYLVVLFYVQSDGRLVLLII